MAIASIRPFDGFRPIGEVVSSSKHEVAIAIKTARKAQSAWGKLRLNERIERLRLFVEIVGRRSEEIAQVISAETGRPITSARGNVASGIEYFEAYFEMADQHLSPNVTLETDSEIHRVIREPWGVVACICPWNFPFLNVAWQCGQALIAGNAVVYKNSEENPLFGQLLAEMVAESDIPDGVFKVLHGNGEVGAWIAESDVDMISFTGSTEVGRKLAVTAAQRFVPFIGELGGSAPCIVFDDVEVEEIVDTIYDNRFVNAGQSCDAIKRLIVHESKFDEVVAKLVDRARRAVVGNPLDEATQMGPLVSQRQLDRLTKQVRDAVDRRAKVECGGGTPAGLDDGAYFEPTILTNVTTDMSVWREETFGPVLPVIAFETEDEAITLANDTDYGLGAWVMTADASRFERVAIQSKSGIISHNNVGYWSPHNPFGGYKHSGMGRTHGEYGFHEMTQIKLLSTLK